jgi:mannose-6-phosphate isomerase-like protein (cupin superfamily)
LNEGVGKPDVLRGQSRHLVGFLPPEALRVGDFDSGLALHDHDEDDCHNNDGGQSYHFDVTHALVRLLALADNYPRMSTLLWWAWSFWDSLNGMDLNGSGNLTSYLSGQVRKLALAGIQPGSMAQAPALKRLILPQGELAQLLDGSQAMHYLAVVELRPGTVRGNHFHKNKGEYVYLITGRADLRVEELQTKAQEKIPLGPGDLAFVSTGVAHRIEVLEAGDAVEFSEAPFDPGDTYRYVLHD